MVHRGRRCENLEILEHCFVCINNWVSAVAGFTFKVISSNTTTNNGPRGLEHETFDIL